MRRLYLIVFFLVPYLSSATFTGPEENYSLVHDFNKDWLVYDYKLGNFIPFIASIHADYPAKTIFIDKDNFEPYELLIKSENKESFIFVNGSLFKKISKDKWEILHVNQLPALNKENETCITLYSVDAQPRFIAQIAFAKNSTKESVISQVSNNRFIMKPRKGKINYNGIITCFLFIFAIGTILSGSYSRAFGRFFNFNELFNFIIRDTSFLINKPLSRINMAFVILLSFLTAYVLFVISGIGTEKSIFDQLFFKGVQYYFQIANFFILALLSFISYLLKLFFLRISGKLFNLDRTVELHFFRIIQYNLVVFTILAIMLFILKVLYLPLDINYYTLVVSVATLIYLGRFINLALTINRTVQVSTLYLISYLCVVEILPITIGLKFLLFH